MNFKQTRGGCVAMVLIFVLATIAGIGYALLEVSRVAEAIR